MNSDSFQSEALDTGRDLKCWCDMSLSLVLLRTRLLQGFVGSDLIESNSEPLLWHFVTAIQGVRSSVSNHERVRRFFWMLIAFLMHHRYER